MTQVLITTNLGNITVELNEKEAPVTVAHFLDYVNGGHYSNTIFHRVIDGFMIQGGGFNTSMVQKPTQMTVANEAKNGLRNDNYTIAMARTADPHSASAQFFINVKDNNFLNHPGQDGWGYCVFGKITEGKEVVDEIKKVKTTRKGMFADVPAISIVIEKIELLQDPAIEGKVRTMQHKTFVQDFDKTDFV